MHYHTTTHLTTEEWIDLAVRLREDFWSSQVFLETVRLSKDLDVVIADLIAVNAHKKLSFKSRYNKLKREQPAYNPLLTMPMDEFEGILRTMNNKKLYKAVMDLSYEKSLLEAMPLVRNLKSFLAEMNYVRANFGKEKPKFGLDPNYIRSASRHTPRNLGPDEDR